jgi:tRNA(Ile)-lysidine synthase
MSLESRLLTALTPWLAAPSWRVAFSGGLDSSVLLHLLTRLAARQAVPPISAIHVHHGLQPAAEAWPTHCARFCAEREVPLQILRVQVAPGASQEQAARQARYAAISELLAPGEVVLLGQHRDDQAETLLFRLLRGAGVRGLSAMPSTRALGAGCLLRPLLECGRQELEAYARAQGLQWVEDPSNQQLRYARNYLRQNILPALHARWPQASASLARSAWHMAEAQGLLDELAVLDLASAQSPSRFPWLPIPSLALAPLQQLSAARQRNALRHWLAEFTSLPDSDHWAGWQALRDAGVDAAPRWCLASGELHRADQWLWFLSGSWLDPVTGPVAWPDISQPLVLPGNGQVRLLGELDIQGLHVRYRQGGEQLHIAGRGHRDLKRLLNEAGVPGFVRGRLPLLYRGEALLAVANLPALNPPTVSLLWAPPGDASLS